MNKTRQKIKFEKVTKPYLRGSMIDRTFPGAALKFFFFTVLMALAYMMGTIIMAWDHPLVIAAINIGVIAAMLIIFWQSGATSGADAVNQGEIMLQRQEKGRPVADWERSMCYHPLKGLLVALVGSIPLLVLSIVLACIAERQVHYTGSLPAYLSSMENRPEIYDALIYYRQEPEFSLLTILRPIMRVVNMPYVNLLNPDDWDAQLVLERISPVINILPALAYGVGYYMGIYVRASVHKNIAIGKQKAKRKQLRERRARQQGGHRPEELN